MSKKLNKLKINKEYFNMLELEYYKPSKDVVKLLKKTLKNTDNEILHHQHKSFVTVIKLCKDVFVIHELITKKEYRDNGFGTKLMEKVHNKYKGIFILRTHTARTFYEKLGYVYVGNKTLCFINKDLFSRKYYLLK